MIESGLEIRGQSLDQEALRVVRKMQEDVEPALVTGWEPGQI